MEFPNNNNVYGHIIVSKDLKSLVEPISTLVREDKVFVKTFCGLETLKFSTETVEFETTHILHPKYLLNGAVSGGIEKVIEFTQKLSDCLTEENVIHHFEIYDGDEIVCEIENLQTKEYKKNG